MAIRPDCSCTQRVNCTGIHPPALVETIYRAWMRQKKDIYSTVVTVCRVSSIMNHKPLVLAMLAAMVTISHQETVRQVANGGITLSGSTVSVNISGQTAQFNTTATGHQSFQLCSDGSTLTLYKDCANPQTQCFGPTSLSGVTMIGIAGSPLSNSATFIGNITQLYFISCSGPAVVTQEMVNLQCQANPRNCSVPHSNLADVLTTYETNLNTKLVSTVTCSPATPTSSPTVCNDGVSVRAIRLIVATPNVPSTAITPTSTPNVSGMAITPTVSTYSILAGIVLYLVVLDLML